VEPQQILYYDSLAAAAMPHIVFGLVNAFSSVTGFNDIGGYDHIVQNCRKQDDTYNCGIYMLLNAVQEVSPAADMFRDFDAEATRTAILCCVLSGSVKLME